MQRQQYPKQGTNLTMKSRRSGVLVFLGCLLLLAYWVSHWAWPIQTIYNQADAARGILVILGLVLLFGGLLLGGPTRK